MLRRLIYAQLILWLSAIGCSVLAAEDCLAQSLEDASKVIRVPGIDEPAELRVAPVPKMALSPAEVMWGKEQISMSLPAINRILGKYPDWGDGYFIRLESLCKGVDRPTILANINNALKYGAGSITATGEPLSRMRAHYLSMRAKIEHDNKDDPTALSDLDRAVRADPDFADNFANSGAIAPEKTTAACTWSELDIEGLVQRYPNDYRTHLLRGLYYDHFNTFAKGEELRQRALDNYRESATLSPTEALPHYFSAKLLLKGSLFSQSRKADQQLRKLYEEPLREFDKAIANDPRLVPALLKRADAYSRLKAFDMALADFSRAIAVNPNNAGAYHDRALVKSELGRSFDAINDFNEAIEREEPALEAERYFFYENRADEYIKVSDWNHAIQDLTEAITLMLRSSLFLMNVKQFRSIYPEYKSASNETVAHKLNRTFFPGMTFEGFTSQFLRQIKADDFPLSSSILPELFIKRADASLKAGNWHAAAVDYHRAVDGFAGPNMIDRWHDTNLLSNSRNLMDLQTFDDHRQVSVRLWLKTVEDKSDGPYEVTQYEVNCATHKLRVALSAQYDANGGASRVGRGGGWQTNIPGSLGEATVTAACTHR